MRQKLSSIVMVLGLVLAVGCSSLQPISTQLPEGATGEHLYLAAREDYNIFQKDVNSYLALPSVSKSEARKIDEVMDRAEQQLAIVEAQRKAGQDVQYGIAVSVIQTVIAQICAGRTDEIDACAGR